MGRTTNQRREWVMSTKGKVAITMWIAWGVAVVALAVTSHVDAGWVGVFGAIILGITTVRLFRNSD